MLLQFFECIGVTIEFKGEGLNEIGIVAKNSENAKVSIGQEIIKIDPRYFRPTEVESLLGNSKKARDLLGWTPKYTLKKLTKEMIEKDIKLFKPDRN